VRLPSADSTRSEPGSILTEETLGFPDVELLLFLMSSTEMWIPPVGPVFPL